MLMPLDDIHKSRMVRQDFVPTQQRTTDESNLRNKVHELMQELALLQTKLRKAMDDNDTLTRQLANMKANVTAEKEKRALAAFKKRVQEQKETTQKIRTFLQHEEPVESDDE